MRFIKKYQRGIFLLFLLLIIISGIPIVKTVSNYNLIDENSVSMNAPEDPYEPNDTPGTAYDISFNEGYWLSYIMGPGAQWNDDYYEIFVSPGEERLIVFLRFKHHEGDIDIELINGSDYTLITGSYSVSDDECIDYYVPAGTYYLRVYMANTGSNYDLFWEDFDPAMTDDYYEENDFDYEAYWLPQASWLSDVNGLGFQNDDDWYEIRLEPGEEHLFAELVYNRDMGWLEMQIYDGFDYLFFEDIIDHTFGFSGTLWLRVLGDYSGLIYNLWWEDISPGAGDDPFEENDDFYQAAPIDPGYFNLRMVDYDEDWYWIHLNSGETIEIMLFFDDFQGDLDLELWTPSENYHTGSHTSGNDEYIMETVQESGPWRIRVIRTWMDPGYVEMWYDLDIQLPMAQRDDDFEENDGFWTAASVMPGLYDDLRIIEDDEDWFQVYLNPGDIIDVNLRFFHEEGDLQLELYDPSNNKRDGSYSSAWNYDWSKEHIIFKANTPGDWRIRIYHETGDSRVQYQLEIMIVDDFYEYNNEWERAYNLEDDEYTWLSNVKGLAVQGDDDWYRIAVTMGFERLVVNLKYNNTLGNIYMNIYQIFDQYIIDWNPVLFNYSMNGDDSVDINATISWGTYYIQIYGDNVDMEYDLWWDDLRTDFRPDDDFEENDDPSTAFDLSDYENTQLFLIFGLPALQYDDDWYQIPVYSGETYVVVELFYDYQEGPMGVELYDWNYQRLNMSFSERDNAVLKYDVPSNGTYYIRVFGDLTGNVYSLRWHTKEPEIDGWIPGYDIFLLFGAIFGVATVIMIKFKRSKKNY
ncbi:MAG: PPC domain-containing protein [Promethearchaeota archaeon]